MEIQNMAHVPNDKNRCANNNCVSSSYTERVIRAAQKQSGIITKPTDSDNGKCVIAPA